MGAGLRGWTAQAHETETLTLPAHSESFVVQCKLEIM